MSDGASVKDRVRSYWHESPNGSTLTSAAAGTAEFYAEIERARYAAEPFIPTFADFDGARGKTVLEIGIGVGTDFVRFARAGAVVTGVDLTERSVALVRQRLADEGLQGRVQVADAEALPFESQSFDRVYSWGVLHHTPNTPRAIREAVRVLRPGGELCVMLYARHSWFAYAVWARFALLRGRPWQTLADVLHAHMESEGTTAYTKRELTRLFAGLEQLRIDKVATKYDRDVAGPLVGLTGSLLGWFMVIRGRAAAPGAPPQ
jgi:ubiquinone/menaquinone biosynthesis C-methylase UbiE